MQNLNTLLQLIKINSYTTNREGVNEKQDFIQELLKDLPVSFQRISDDTYGDFMVVRSDKIDSNKPVIAMVFHIDTVHKLESEIETYIDDGKLYGPGSMDMQGSIFVGIEVVEKLHIEGKLQNIVMVFNSCEEKGSPEFQSTVRDIANEVTHVMVYESAESSNQYKAGSKEFLHTFVLATGRKGIFQQVIETEGPGGHSGMLSKKEDRKNAIAQAAHMMVDIDALANYDKQTTVNLAYVNGGRENTVISEDCRFVFDVRYKFEDERQRVKNAVSEILNNEFVAGVKTKDLGYNYDLPSWQPNENTSKFFSDVVSVGTGINIKIEGAERGGWSDGCNFYFYNNDLFVLDGFGPKGEGEHTVGEFLYIDTIEPAINLSYNVIKELLK
ncbi:M20/M25/M40 family metallo-hydrolase [Candidatus Dojkabacteria bacterium]|uniref:M20/M25/M40 family metallo-hydrolase n=1 Tax=Candidatus Dojkabacteria bacterium TaxID=2099670 RepID=A0A955L756_9BACT|nr:M20/M25/M40 family metallo-hydrolase [Candidatus Dojkabacteria bacterium]